MSEGLPGGWTFDRLSRMANQVARSRRGRILDIEEAMDVAAVALVERLYAEPEPTVDDLFTAASRAVNSANKQEISFCGLTMNPHRSGSREGTPPRFATYWYGRGVLVGQFEDRVVDAIAAMQVWAALSERDRQTLGALMTEGTHEGARGLLGISSTAWRTRLSLARRHARELWHWPDAPAPQWALDRRVDGAKTLHGTRILAHRRREEQRRLKETAA